MSDSARHITECRVCGRQNWQQVASYGMVPLANALLEEAESYDDEPRYPLGVVSCRFCRLMSLTHVVDPAVLYRDYLYVTPDSRSMAWHMRRVVELCRRRFNVARDSFVLEIGSNTGLQLDLFRQQGMRTLGVDPARNIARVANDNGIETWPEFFSAEVGGAVRRRFGQPKLILGRHVFAHIDDIAGVAAGVRELLSLDGVFAIEVPYALELLEKTAFDTIYHEHLSYFTVGTLRTFFDRHGMRVLDVEPTEVHGGSVLVFVGHRGGPWRTRAVVDEICEQEERAALHDDETYRRFARDVERVRTELGALVRELVAEGNRVAGYGAPAKGNTLLNLCGLDGAQLEFCSDTTPLKQGKVLPGTHVPVRSPEYAEDHAPDYYLLLAWNYARDILAKESAFLSGGGRFIVPIPRPAIVPGSGLPGAVEAGLPEAGAAFRRIARL
ncbi:class I SAM-dependent methyltransferase [Saccharopolyspora rosea]|uniref:Class I SAM-dependent methyltransferase n=1 Tax=Saccharopolyspora rosea TaxID=524884 RepID=A0ABW3FX45_9PSEU|nr:class I SAM-dependent methyltransferase [Saccharopolyspora rosea]